MLLEKERWAGIRDGSITVLFRRWRHRQATAGKIYRTGAGRIAVDELAVVTPGEISQDDARAAGYASVDAVMDDLKGTTGDPIYRLRIHLVTSPDPREVLANSDELDDDEVATIAEKLARMDRSGGIGPWTERTLEIIGRLPATRAPDLAEELGLEPHRFKVNVRKLKNLGLTISLRIGYRLSPRGTAYLNRRCGCPREES